MPSTLSTRCSHPKSIWPPTSKSQSPTGLSQPKTVIKDCKSPLETWKSNYTLQIRQRQRTKIRARCLELLTKPSPRLSIKARKAPLPTNDFTVLQEDVVETLTSSQVETLWTEMYSMELWFKERSIPRRALLTHYKEVCNTPSTFTKARTSASWLSKSE